MTTIAGSGKNKIVDGRGKDASFSSTIADIAVSENHLYVSENHCIRQICLEDNSVITITGHAKEYGQQDGTCALATFYSPHQICVGGDGVIYIADLYNNAVRTLVESKTVRTLTGGYDNGFEDGRIDRAKFYYPSGIASDRYGRIFVADRRNQRIREVSTIDHTVTTVIGNGKSGCIDGRSQTALIDKPTRLLLDSSSNSLYFTQQHCIRKVSLVSVPLPSLEKTMTEDLQSLAKRQDLADVVFTVGDSQVHGVSAILRLRCPYFDGLLSSATGISTLPTAQSRVTSIPIEDADPGAFSQIISYLTTDRIDLEEAEQRRLFDVLGLCERLHLETLKKYCEELLAQRLQPTNAIEILNLAHQQSAEHLKEAALLYVTRNSQYFRGKKEMEDLPSELLAEIMKNLP